MFRCFQAHCIASFGVAITSAIPHGIPPCSSAFEYLVFAPLHAPAFLIVALLGDTYAWRHPLDVLIAYLTYSSLFAISLLLSRPVNRPHSHPICPTCSYNLTANTSGICPECGTPVPVQNDSKAKGTSLHA